MSRFSNKLCPVCRIQFNEKSDIVVCPECGTPHHRPCFFARGHCAVEEHHAHGFVWNGRLPDEPEAASQTHTAPPQAEPLDADLLKEELEAVQSFEELMELLNRRSMDDTRGEDGVSSKELSCFVGRSVMHYSNAFSAIRSRTKGDKKRFISINYCAGLFAPLHQFYRRMDWIGIAVAAVMLLTSLPSMLVMMGVVELTPDNQAILQIIQLLGNLIRFAVTVVMCVFGDYLYYKFCVKRIKKIRARFDDGRKEGYYEALTDSGSPSWLRAVIGLLAFVLLSECIMVLPGLSVQ